MTQKKTGWRPLITSTVQIVQAGGFIIRRRTGSPERLLFETVSHTSEFPGVAPFNGPPEDWVRGILTTAYVLSGEICHDCGGPGDPVELASGQRTTLCTDCREDGDRTLPRPPWRPEHDPSGDRPVLEEIIGTEEIAALMEAKHTVENHRGWPVRLAGRSVIDSPLLASCVGHPGWNHLVRAALSVLLPHECSGTRNPWRLDQLKEKFGQLVIYHNYSREPFFVGVSRLVKVISTRMCIYCGRPGRQRNNGWVHPACDPCSKTRSS